MKKQNFKKIFSAFNRSKILVIGDLILDEFIWGQAQRISPEAPVPIVWAKNQSYMPGGASNVANNIASLGAQVSLCGIIGDDKNGNILLDKLAEKQINSDGVIVDSLRPTTVKTRIIAAHQQVVRLDWEDTEDPSSDKIEAIIKAVKRKIKEVDALIVEDYGKGTITPYLLKNIIAIAKRHKKIITVDPKVNHFSYYKGVTAITPNEKEASEASGIKIEALSDVDRVGHTLQKELRCKGVLITLGEKGMKLFVGRRIIHIPTVAQEVFDVSGAGDTVISVFTLALCCGAKMQDAAEISNIAAGIVVGKIGVATVSRKEIIDAWRRIKR